jgi:hypothetical protein
MLGILEFFVLPTRTQNLISYSTLNLNPLEPNGDITHNLL